MKLAIPNCPTCSKPAIGTVDVIPGTALFIKPPDSKRAVEYLETRVHWDGQTTQLGPNQLPLLTCGEHEWESQIGANAGAHARKAHA